MQIKCPQSAKGGPILDLAYGFAALLAFGRQAVHCRLQLLCYLLTICLGQAVHNATLHVEHFVSELFADQVSYFLHSICKLGLLLAHLVSAVQCISALQFDIFPVGP